MKLPRLFHRRQAPSPADGAVGNDQGGGMPLNLPQQLLWLLDAPLFIDTRQVEAFYDAILRPDYEGTSVTLSNSITTETTFGGQATVGAALPWFGKAEFSGNVARSHSRDEGRDTTLRPISNAYRHLLSLALHYASQPDHNRLVIADTSGTMATDSAGEPILDKWLTPEFAEAPPRSLVFLDILPGSAIIPAALELVDGSVQVVAETLGNSLGGRSAPQYPGSTAAIQNRDAYFRWFTENYNDRIAVETVETAVHGTKIAWIDFNTSVAAGMPPFMHLHLAGHGEYDTGTFGYNMIVRGFNYGLRIVGTLKSGPDLNVLAIFER
jgi:hypothetical protein